MDYCNLNWIENNKLSCAMDYFFTIFIFNLYDKIKTFDYKDDDNYSDEFNKFLFENIMKFTEYIETNFIHKKFSFYNEYIDYINNNNLFNFLLITDDEILKELHSTSVYRSLYNINFFAIKYKKISNFNGLCKFKNILK